MGCGNFVYIYGMIYIMEVLGFIWLDDVFCSGNELIIWDCEYVGWGKYNCVYREDVIVICLGKIYFVYFILIKGIVFIRMVFYMVEVE